MRGSNDFDVLLHHFRRIALRIDGDEERSYLRGVRPELLKRRGDREQRRRAAIWTEGIPEIDQQPFAAISLIGHCRAVQRRERKWTADRHRRRA